MSKENFTEWGRNTKLSETQSLAIGILIWAILIPLIIMWIKGPIEPNIQSGIQENPQDQYCGPGGQAC